MRGPIEDLVRWALREELPKAVRDRAGLVPRRRLGFGSGWGAVAEQGALLCATVDDGRVSLNRYGVVGHFDQRLAGEPHPDALAVHAGLQALDALAEAGLALEAGDWQPLADFGDLGPLGAAAVARGLEAFARGGEASAFARRPRELVTSAAILGPPDWRGEQPRLDVERHQNGQPKWFSRRRVVSDGAFAPVAYEIEVDGFDWRRRRPYDDAYRREVLVPDPVPVVIARAEYQVWRAALDVLAEEIAPLLQEWVLQPCAVPWEPWCTGVRAGRVLWAVSWQLEKNGA